MNIKDDKIWCHYCLKWINKYIDILLLEEDVFCLLCYDDKKGIRTHLGYRKDLFPCKYYYEDHYRGNCRCVQEETNCNNNEENCEYPLGRTSYEEELNDN
jgi:hypothetical protein